MCKFVRRKFKLTEVANMHAIATTKLGRQTMEWELLKTSWYVSDGLGPVCAGCRLCALCSLSSTHSCTPSKLMTVNPNPKQPTRIELMMLLARALCDAHTDFINCNDLLKVRCDAMSRNDIADASHKKRCMTKNKPVSKLNSTLNFFVWFASLPQKKDHGVRGQIREKSSARFLTAFEGISASKNSHAEIFKKMAIFTLILIYLHVKQ